MTTTVAEVIDAELETVNKAVVIDIADAVIAVAVGNIVFNQGVGGAPDVKTVVGVAAEYVVTDDVIVAKSDSEPVGIVIAVLRVSVVAKDVVDEEAVAGAEAVNGGAAVEVAAKPSKTIWLASIIRKPCWGVLVMSRLRKTWWLP